MCWKNPDLNILDIRVEINPVSNLYFEIFAAQNKVALPHIKTDKIVRKHDSKSLKCNVKNIMTLIKIQWVQFYAKKEFGFAFGEIGMGQAEQH